MAGAPCVIMLGVSFIKFLGVSNSVLAVSDRGWMAWYSPGQANLQLSK